MRDVFEKNRTGLKQFSFFNRKGSGVTLEMKQHRRDTGMFHQSQDLKNLKPIQEDTDGESVHAPIVMVEETSSLGGAATSRYLKSIDKGLVGMPDYMKYYEQNSTLNNSHGNFDEEEDE